MVSANFLPSKNTKKYFIYIYIRTSDLLSLHFLCPKGHKKISKLEKKQYDDDDDNKMSCLLNDKCEKKKKDPHAREIYTYIFA